MRDCQDWEDGECSGAGQKEGGREVGREGGTLDGALEESACDAEGQPTLMS